ncbi:MAG: hypothetical protein IPO64_09640 [Bacteroidetes bacterium]|nr:hypothetical protein [Bacteroidota bacterium]
MYHISLNVAISFFEKTTRANKYTALNEQTAQIPTDDNTGDEWQLNLLEQFIRTKD